MSGFYFSFSFESKHCTSYFLPLKLKTNDIDIAEKCFVAMKTAISEKYKITSFSRPVVIIKDINEHTVKEFLQKPFKGKMGTLKASEWSFVNFEPDLEFSFNENLGTATSLKIEEIENNFGMIQSEPIARCIQRYNFPVQVLYDPEKWNENEFLAVELVSIT